MSLKLGTQDIAGISQNTKYNAHHLLDFKWTDCIMNDVSWLRADTFSWQSGDVYTSAYNHLVQDIQGITAETETIGSYTVTFYRATDGHKICLADQEQTVLNIYNETGIAWYYIVDTTNTQFKLPRTKYGFEGLRTNVGDNINESLPNITGQFMTRPTNNARGTGVFADSYYNYEQNNGLTTGSGFGNVGENEIIFNASRSSSTYQDNAPVQERATQMYLYFYVGDYTQSAIEQTAGLNSELFNGKVDVDLANVNDQAKILMGGMAMPSDKYINLTLGASGSTYTAPANGWFYAQIAPTTSGTGRLYLKNNTKDYKNTARSYSDGADIATTLPVCKGDVVQIDYLNMISWSGNLIRFYYAQGSESEAQ